MIVERREGESQDDPGCRHQYLARQIPLLGKQIFYAPRVRGDIHDAALMDFSLLKSEISAGKKEPFFEN